MTEFGIRTTVSLRQLFEPSGVAVVGASKTEGKIGYEAMANAARFDGPVYPVNPSASGELFGAEFVASQLDTAEGTAARLFRTLPEDARQHVRDPCGEFLLWHSSECARD